MTEKTTVVLVDDHPVFRKGLRMLLEDEPDFSVIGEAGDGEQAIALISELQPDIAVLDISMPDVSGIEVAECVSRDCPKTRVVALSIHSEKRFVEDMLMAGAAGYILKQTAPEDLVNGIRTVMNGESFLSPSITSVVLSGFRYGQSMEQSKEIELSHIIHTKLYPHQLPDNHVARRELIKKLDKGSRLPVLLITAPAGYGKSTLVSSWLHQQSLPFGWVSLAETENDLRQFLFYLVHAVQSLFSGKLAKTEMLVNSAKLPPVHALAVSVLQEIGQIEENFILVLDDIHLVKEKGVYDFLSEILRHPPHHLHFIIMGRRDPFLPIASLRGNRFLAEIRAKELRFSLDETRRYLELVLGEGHNARLAEVFHRKMEGWVAGLRLAIMSTGEVRELEEMLLQLDGESQFVQEYLFNEVLDKQTPMIRTNITILAILDRFCGPLCEAVIRTADSGKNGDFSGWDFLKELQQLNLFLVSLDTENIWYRFHHLFQKLLEKQLVRSVGSEKRAELHRTASKWFESNGFLTEGIKHAIKGQDIDRAERIVQQNRHKELGRDRWSNVEKWLLLFPEEEKRNRPTLLLAVAWVCHDRYRLQDMAAVVDQLDMITANDPLEGAARGEFLFLKGVLDYWESKSEGCLKYMDEARALLPETYSLVFGLIEMYEALAHQMNGKNVLAVEQLKNKTANVSGKTAIFRSRLIASLSFVHYIEGNLYQAFDAAARMQILSAQNNLSYTETWGYYMLGNASLQMFDLVKAKDHFSVLKDKMYIMHSMAAIDAMAGLALTCFFQHGSDEAFAISGIIDDFARQTHDHDLIIVAHSLKARLFLLCQDDDGAKKSLQFMGVQPSPKVLFTWIELIEITRIKVLISIGTSKELELANQLLARVKQQIVSAHNHCHLVDVQVLEAQLLLKTEGVEAALAPLEKAVSLAAQGGWVMPFIEAGRPIIELLGSLVPTNEEMSWYIKAILRIGCVDYRNPTVTEEASTLDLDESLTSRESEILELLAQRLRNKEIGEKLFISPETVKSHIKRLFSKLDAVNRRDVVEKAIALGLLKK